MSVVLDFWELDDDFSAWLYAEVFEVRRSSGGPLFRYRRTSSEAVAAVHALLGHGVTAVDVSGGRLSLAFAGGAEVLVRPLPDDQSWALSF